MSMRTMAALALALAAIATAGAGIAVINDRSYAFYAAAWCVFSLVGVVLAIRRPDNVIGWLFLVLGLGPQFGPLVEIGTPVDPSGGLSSIARTIVGQSWVLTFGLLPVLLILFPNGRPKNRPWSIVIFLAAVIIALGTISASDKAGVSVLSIVFGPDVVPAADAFQGATMVVLTALFFLGAASLVLRARDGGAEERLQLKWVVYAGGLLAAVMLGTFVAWLTPLRDLDPSAEYPVALFGGVPFLAALVTVPVAVGVAVLRYRLYEIDALINRTVVYGSVTAILIVAYVAGVAAFQFLLAPFTSGSPIAVALSTLAVIGLFHPLRSAIQGAVDRRFYRRRYDAIRALDTFAGRMRDQIDLESVERELIAAITETVHPAQAGLWLRGPLR